MQIYGLRPPIPSVDMIYSPIAKTQLEWLASLNPLEHSVENKFFRKTSIISTIGPKTNNVPMLTALRKAGMNIGEYQCWNVSQNPCRPNVSC